MSDYNFIIDIQSRRLVADYFSTEAGTPPSIVFGDQPTVNVQLVEANNDSADYPWKSVALTGQSIRVGVGSLEDETPSAYIELTADLAAASSVITEIRTGVLNTTNEIQRVTLTFYLFYILKSSLYHDSVVHAFQYLILSVAM